MVLFRCLGSDAHTGTLLNLAGETSSTAASVEAKRVPAQPCVTGDFMQRFSRLPTRCEWPVQAIQFPRIDMVGSNVLGRSRFGANRQGNHVGTSAQTPVIDGEQFLDELSFAQQRSQFPRGFLEIDARDLGR